MQGKLIVDIAKSLVHLKQPKSYKEIKKGSFTNSPDLEGFSVNLSSIFGNNVFVVINTSESFKNEDSSKNIEGNTFITLNIKDSSSLQDLISKLEKYSKGLIDLLSKVSTTPTDIDTSKKLKYNLPYGYSRLEDGTIEVDEAEAAIADKVFKMYLKYNSMRKVADFLGGSGVLSRSGDRLDLAVTSGILHDSRYLDMEEIVIPKLLFMRTGDILRRNSGQDKTR